MLKRNSRFAAAGLLLFLASGCASMFSGVTNDLAQAILNHDDPETVRTAIPAYLIMIDGLIDGDSDDEDMLSSGATLYAAYAGLFVDDAQRARNLSGRAFDYGRRAACSHDENFCDIRRLPFDELGRRLALIEDADDLTYLGALAQSWLIWIQSNASDWSAVADLPRVELLLETMLRVDENWNSGSAHVYLGMLQTVRPPALGGEPEKARAHFERAIAISGGSNLSAKVAFAERYARMVFEQELHDNLLREVIAADPRASGHTLLNTLAQSRAHELLASSADYF